MAVPHTLESLTWLVGCWQTTVLASPSDCTDQRSLLSSEICFLSPSDPIAGIWRLGEALSFISIRETEDGVEWREREHRLTLEARPNTPLLLMRPHAASPEEVVFQTEGETGHQRVRQFRMSFRSADATVLVVRFLIPDGNGAWSVVREETHHRAS